MPGDVSLSRLRLHEGMECTMASGRKWASRRREPEDVPGSDLSGVTELDLIDVTLVTEFSGARAEVPRLGLAFNKDGMTVRTPDGTPYVRIPWVCIVQPVSYTHLDVYKRQARDRCRALASAPRHTRSRRTRPT